MERLRKFLHKFGEVEERLCEAICDHCTMIDDSGIVYLNWEDPEFRENYHRGRYRNMLWQRKRFMAKHGLTQADVNRVRCPLGIGFVSKNAPEYIGFVRALRQFDAKCAMLVVSAAVRLDWRDRWDIVHQWYARRITLNAAYRALEVCVKGAAKHALVEYFPEPVADHILSFVF